jgi:hypothetical protein
MSFENSLFLKSAPHILLIGLIITSFSFRNSISSVRLRLRQWFSVFTSGKWFATWNYLSLSYSFMVVAIHEFELTLLWSQQQRFITITDLSAQFCLINYRDALKERLYAKQTWTFMCAACLISSRGIVIYELNLSNNVSLESNRYGTLLTTEIDR